MPLSPNSIEELAARQECSPLPSTLEAFENSRRLQEYSARHKIGFQLKWQQRLAGGGRKHVRKKVTFSAECAFFNLKQVTENLVKDIGNAAAAEKVGSEPDGVSTVTTVVPQLLPLSDKIDREIPSVPLLEQALCKLITTNERWATLPGGTRASLEKLLASKELPIAALTADLKRLLWYFQRGRPAILGYRSSYKIRPYFHEMEYDHYRRAWINVGKPFAVAPKLRLYLIKIVRVPDVAATSIQSAWRRRVARKKYNIMYKDFIILCQVFAFYFWRKGGGK